MATWPATIPQKPLYDGYGEQAEDGRIRSSMSAGPDKVRRRFTAVPVPIRCIFSMSHSELSTFETFFETTLSGGALSFDWTHPRKDTSIVCRIVDVPSVSPDGTGYWYVSMTIEVLP